jgi:membrane dipeptidase
MQRSNSVFIIDAHEDIAYNALDWGRDLRSSVYAIREREAQIPGYSDLDAAGGIAMLGLPEMRRGGIGIVFATLFAYPDSAAQKEVNARYRQTQTYTNADEAYRVAWQQLAYYKELAQEPCVSLIRTQGNLSCVLEGCTQSDHKPFGFVLLMEGADPIRTPDELELWYQEGLRIIGLSWASSSRYAGGDGAPGPLTEVGPALLTEMERLGVMLDISHLSDESFWQALEHFRGAVIASHSNCRALLPGPRQLSDDMIHAIIERNGVIGVSPFNSFLVPDWYKTMTPTSLDLLVRHIDHICQLAGNARHVGIGSDIDGGFGRDETPIELDTIADLAKLSDALGHAGYSSEDIICILSGNWLRLLLRTLPA